jgi:hypothetical protein
MIFFFILLILIILLIYSEHIVKNKNKPFHKEPIHKELNHKELIHKEPIHKELNHKEPIHKELNHKELNHKELIHKEPIHKEPEHFTNFVSKINLGICSRSLSKNINKLNGRKVINPFNNCQKNFNWDNYFNSAKFKQLPLNQVYFN